MNHQNIIEQQKIEIKQILIWERKAINQTKDMSHSRMRQYGCCWSSLKFYIVKMKGPNKLIKTEYFRRKIDFEIFFLNSRPFMTQVG